MAITISLHIITSVTSCRFVTIQNSYKQRHRRAYPPFFTFRKVLVINIRKCSYTLTYIIHIYHTYAIYQLTPVCAQSSEKHMLPYKSCSNFWFELPEVFDISYKWFVINWYWVNRLSLLINWQFRSNICKQYVRSFEGLKLSIIKVPGRLKIEIDFDFDFAYFFIYKC